MPRRIATGFIFVIAGMMCIPKNQSVHHVAKKLGLASHDTLERVVMEKCWTAANIMAALITYTLTYMVLSKIVGRIDFQSLLDV